MKNNKGNLLRSLVLIALFAPAAFADGEMGGGGLTGTGDGSRSGKVIVTQTTHEGEMGGGSRPEDAGYIDFIMSAIYDYFEMMT